MPAVCAYPKIIKDVAAGNGAPKDPGTRAHMSRRHLIRIIPPVPDLWNCYVHSDCICNELISAHNRVVGEVPLATDRGVTMLRQALARIRKRMTYGHEKTLDETLLTFKGARKKIYERACESLKNKPFHNGDARIQSFVKAEKTNPSAKTNPDPRMIQARTPRYNLTVAKYLRSVEHQVYNMEFKHMRAVAKGQNQVQRADIIRKKMARFNRPVCFSIDASRFDQHVGYDVLKAEHEFYQSFYPDSSELREVLKLQLNNKCRTKNGVKYSVRGGRMSGDINTALGNVVLAVAMIMAAMKELGIEDYDIYDDGDDMLVWVEEEDFDKVRVALPRVFLEFGQELKIENVARDPQDIVFCQSKMVYNGNTWVMMRDWRKVLSQSTSGTKWWNIPDMVRPMMGMVGACESVLCAGVPILSRYAAALNRISQGKLAHNNCCDSSLIIRYRYETGNDTVEYKESKITSEARLSFERTFGVDIWQQQAIERILDRWDLETTEAITVAVELDHHWTPNYNGHTMIPLIF